MTERLSLQLSAPPPLPFTNDQSSIEAKSLIPIEPTFFRLYGTDMIGCKSLISYSIRENKPYHVLILETPQ
jgi:hypothetical protein